MSSISTMTAVYASFIFSLVIILTFNTVESNSITKSYEAPSNDNDRDSTTTVLTPLHLGNNGTNGTSQPDGPSVDVRANKTDTMLSRLAKYFKIRGKCPDEPEDTNSSAGKFCPPAADFLLCFPKTPVNQTVRIQCPYRDDLEAIDSSGRPF